ncbi:hypothetical protein BLS_009037 [Venturia inaequalis]|uniref:Uncharacterized protein n=1 Tax=Venturia inaequalis TaxID=5025 RepID=A0A8H3VE51_VENIN|nr:hypothetical protein BLS_009037 [Venturia inaequalis]
MSAIGETELEEIYAFAIQLGKEAGDLLLAAADLRMQGDGRKEQTSIEKASSVDLVTQTDEGEESYSKGDTKTYLIKDTTPTWDVAAGICILQEAGGLVTRGNPPDDPLTAPIEDVNLGSRLYLGIRAAGPSDGETARQGQERAVREVWRRVRELDYSRPGI